MTPPTPDLTALEQWARWAKDPGSPLTEHEQHMNTILALCETVRAQQAKREQQKPAYLSRDYIRLWDLVRCQRAELHEEGLITDEEYAQLVAEEPSRPGDGSPSAKRLGSYDELRAENKRLRAEVARLRSERDETLMLAEHPQISDMRDLARELAYRGKRIVELESARTEALVPCCASASCEYCGGTGVAKEMHHG